MGTVVLNSCITVLEDMDLDMLIGMDVLRKGKCEICLVENVLRFRSGRRFTEVPFLSDSASSPVVAHCSTPEPDEDHDGHHHRTPASASPAFFGLKSPHMPREMQQPRRQSTLRCVRAATDERHIQERTFSLAGV